MPGFSGPPGVQGADGELVILHFRVQLVQASSRFRLRYPPRTCIPLKSLLRSQTCGYSNSYSHCSVVCKVGKETSGWRQGQNGGGGGVAKLREGKEVIR